jgi:hypothetical protein
MTIEKTAQKNVIFYNLQNEIGPSTGEASSWSDNLLFDFDLVLFCFWLS